jgi:hypothetical protein
LRRVVTATDAQANSAAARSRSTRAKSGFSRSDNSSLRPSGQSRTDSIAAAAHRVERVVNDEVELLPRHLLARPRQIPALDEAEADGSLMRLLDRPRGRAMSSVASSSIVIVPPRSTFSFRTLIGRKSATAAAMTSRSWFGNSRSTRVEQVARTEDVDAAGFCRASASAR